MGKGLSKGNEVSLVPVYRTQVLHHLSVAVIQHARTTCQLEGTGTFVQESVQLGLQLARTTQRWHAHGLSGLGIACTCVVR